MKTPRQVKFFKKLEKSREDRIHCFKGITGEIIVSKVWSFRQKGSIISILYERDKVHSFPGGVRIKEIKDFIESYKPLKNYCKAPVSQCNQFKNCEVCHTLHKKLAEERKEKGKKLEKPKPEDILERGEILSPINSKKIVFGHGHGVKWQ